MQAVLTCGTGPVRLLLGLLRGGRHRVRKLSEERHISQVSEQHIVDCATKASGCSSGYMQNAFDRVIKNKGIECAGTLTTALRPSPVKLWFQATTTKTLKLARVTPTPASPSAARYPITPKLRRTTRRCKQLLPLVLSLPPSLWETTSTCTPAAYMTRRNAQPFNTIPATTVRCSLPATAPVTLLAGISVVGFDAAAAVPYYIVRNTWGDG